VIPREEIRKAGGRCHESSYLSYATYQPDCSGSELVECGDRHFEMLFLCVLDLIVTNAVQTLHEHHHRRNAGARLRLRRATAPMAFDAGSAPVSRTASSQRSTSSLWKKSVQCSRVTPTQAHIYFRGEFLARGFSFAQHLRQRFFIEVSLVEHDSAFLY
jgi:hypothetical protein